MNKTLLLVAFALGIVVNSFGNDTKEMLFTSPLIYKPVIEMALKKNKEPLSLKDCRLLLLSYQQFSFLFQHDF